MRLLTITFLVISFIMTSCTDANDNCNELPTCIDDLTTDLPNETLKTVKVQTIDDERHFWLNTDALHVDGPEYIVNENCDTLCYFCGECVDLDCAKIYDPADWNTLWEK